MRKKIRRFEEKGRGRRSMKDFFNQVGREGKKKSPFPESISKTEKKRGERADKKYVNPITY
ncbi:hypothetical protein [uncultured Bacteroides sp.]|uniref:hypothetical protein n=1 Tax=uncultured Bacteroides sp. TaxID=162156 RepID=UPI0025EED8BB|nr:hypothetical protein [uncultured Bacteroides sp.]